MPPPYATAGYPANQASSYMRPIVDGWVNKIALAKEAKKPFSDIADQCMAFFSQATGFMWKPKFKSKFLGGDITPPKYQVTIAKAFELVAIFGPTLYWKYPNRIIRNEEPIEFEPEFFGDPNDPMTQFLFESAVKEQEADKSRGRIRNRLIEKYLNYSQREQPGGGLSQHSEVAYTEALIKGRACLWPESYSFPGSDRTLTGCFHDSVDNLLIDPDCRDPLLRGCTWISRMHKQSHWKVERRFNWPKDSLKGKGQTESAESHSVRRSAGDRLERKHGRTHDEITWYEIWSTGGVGTRMTDVNSTLHDAFDDVVGDYAYICVVPGVDSPLNAPDWKIQKSSDEEVQEMFDWPVPFYLDDRWPVSLIDFYRQPGSAWPIAPLAPGLGELICLNILTSIALSKAHAHSQEIIAYLQSAAQDVEDALRTGKNPAFVPINVNAHSKISEMIQFLQHPQMNLDIWKAINYLTELFDKRTGLTELAYGLNPGGKMSRTAADIKSRQESMRVRPDFMASKVEQHQAETAELEKFVVRWKMEADDIQPLLGRHAAMLWDELITSQDPEIVVREMKATVEAGSARKPNKQRDTENLNQSIGYLLPELSKHADTTGDTSQINAFFERFGDAIEMDMHGLKMGPRVPPSDDEAVQLEKQKLQADVQKTQADVQVKQLDAAIKIIELEIKRIEAQVEAATGGADVQKQRIDMLFERMKHLQQLRGDQEKHDQEVAQDWEEHVMDMLQKRQEGELKLDLMEDEGDAKVAQMRREARAKPATASSNGKG